MGSRDNGSGSGLGVIVCLVLTLASVLGAASPPAVARPLAGETQRPMEPGSLGLTVVHRPPPAAVNGRDLTLALAHANACSVGCRSPRVSVEVEGVERTRYPVQRAGAAAAGSLRVTLPAPLVTGSHIRYRLTVSQQECGLHVPRCRTWVVRTAWSTVPILGKRPPLPHAQTDAVVPTRPPVVLHQATPQVQAPNLEVTR